MATQDIKPCVFRISGPSNTRVQEVVLHPITDGIIPFNSYKRQGVVFWRTVPLPLSDFLDHHASSVLLNCVSGCSSHSSSVSSFENTIPVLILQMFWYKHGGLGSPHQCCPLQYKYIGAPPIHFKIPPVVYCFTCSLYSPCLCFLLSSCSAILLLNCPSRCF